MVEHEEKRESEEMGMKKGAKNQVGSNQKGRIEKGRSKRRGGA